MAIQGKSGALYVGAAPDKVAEMKSWSLDLGADNIDVTTFDSNGWKEFLAGLKEWSGSAEGNFKLEDTQGQKALFDAWINGTVLAAEFRLGAATPKFTGSVLVTGVSVEDAVDGEVTISFDLQGTGSLTYVS